MKIERIRRKVAPIFEKYGVTKSALFGSIARNEDTPDSDIDILVEISADISLLEFIHFKHELEDILGKPVDLVEYGTLKPAIRDQILQEQVALI